MYVKDIILEGFKSYAQRTTVSGFDQHFNAITGLNGSGKSNILDAICFVLGIQNLSLVRVNNLQGLVYKKGQAGVKKASVTIIFDNTDKSKSPAAYEQFDEITVTRQVTATKDGKNKFLINGHNSQQANVKNLFHSIGLNVNNPHFLIMQGRITKIVKMKPPEILGLLEEAAGTKMFELRKEAAIKTLGKKQPKVDEYHAVIQEEIAPKLEKLAREQKNYIQWTTNSKEIEALSRLAVANDFTSAATLLSQSDEHIQAKRDEIEALKAQQSQCATELEAISRSIDELTAHKDAPDDSDGLATIEKRVNSLSKTLVKKNSEWAHAKETLATHYDKQKSLRASLQAMEDSIRQSEAELQALRDTSQQLNEAAEAANHELSERKRQFQAALAGAATEADDESAKSWADQMMEAKRAAASAATDQKQAKMKIAHLQKELPFLREELKTLGQSSSKLQKEYDAATAHVQQLQAQLAQIPFDEDKEQQLTHERRSLEDKKARLRETADDLSARLARFNFTFENPHPQFDRSKVKGLLAHLVEIKDPQRDAVALEVTAGARLYNVVVDTDDTATQLIDRGRLARRVTIIPLNKITPYVLPSDTVRKAQKLAGGPANATVALSLVGTDEQVRKAAEYVFGSTMICPNMDVAQIVAKGVQTRCVTSDGEVYETGTLTGGSRSAQQPILRQLWELNQVRQQLAQIDARLQAIDEELHHSKAYHEAKRQHTMASHQAELLLQRLGSTASHQLQSRVTHMESDLAACQEQIGVLQAREKEAHAKVEELQAQESTSAESQHDARIKALQAKIAQAKESAVEANNKQKAAQQQQEELVLEIKEAQDELKAATANLHSLDEAISRVQEQADELESEVADSNQEYAQAKERLQERRDALQKANDDIQGLVQQQRDLQKQAEKAGLDVKKAEHAISKLKKERVEAEGRLQRMLTKHTWIEQEKQFFGQGEYHTGQSPADIRKRLASLESEQAKLSKSINRKVMNMFDNAKKEYDDLKEKINILNKNKATIEGFIADLDEKKKGALQSTWEQVNVDFAAIFSTLLPGWTAKLEPPEGQTFLEGLRILFARGGVWKQSLSELSGGQRSLLALSLILALLRVKPAPVYILDEVDSALDLSNTQNIGKMLKTHFPQSQFIVVSLKEGMWNNANVLFRTKFVDGISQVSRERRGRF